MNDLGRNTPQGFIPTEPNIDGLIQSMTGGQSVNALLAGLLPKQQGTDDSGKTPAPSDVDMLRDDYVAIFNTDRGRRVLEDLLDQTLRRVFCQEQAGSIEADALYARQRHGQNSIVMYVCKMIADGQAKQVATKQNKSKKSK